jgi:hypothetical protein
MSQDERYPLANKDKMDPELLAAKVCDRWRNGVPLALSPNKASPAAGIRPEQLNNYDYVNADGSGYDPTQPCDGIERGLLGYFINSNLEIHPTRASAYCFLRSITSVKFISNLG